MGVMAIASDLEILALFSRSAVVRQCGPGCHSHSQGGEAGDRVWGIPLPGSLGSSGVISIMEVGGGVIACGWVYDRQRASWQCRWGKPVSLHSWAQTPIRGNHFGKDKPNLAILFTGRAGNFTRRCVRRTSASAHPRALGCFAPPPPLLEPRSLGRVALPGHAGADRATAAQRLALAATPFAGRLAGVG